MDRDARNLAGFLAERRRTLARACRTRTRRIFNFSGAKAVGTFGRVLGWIFFSEFLSSRTQRRKGEEGGGVEKRDPYTFLREMRLDWRVTYHGLSRHTLSGRLPPPSPPSHFIGQSVSRTAAGRALTNAS